MRVLVGVAVLARLTFWVLAIYIVGHGVLHSWATGDPGMAIGKAIFFPLTYLIYPWTAGLVAAFIVSLLAYWLSTALGMRPVE